MELKEFSIQDISVFRNDDNVDFAIVELKFLSDGNNAQNCPISTDVLKQYANTVLGKPIVAKFHKWQNDVGTHELDEVIIGYVPHNAEVKFEYNEMYGKTFAVVQGVISKIYATDVYNLFTEINERAVSSEFSCTQNNPNEYGEGEITSYAIHGITVLGRNVRPAVEGAKINVKKFSSTDIDEFYDNKNNLLKKFANNRKNKLNNKNFNNLDKEATMEEEKLFAESVSEEKEKDVVMEDDKEMSIDNSADEKDKEAEQPKEMSDEKETDEEDKKVEEMSCDKEMSDDQDDKDETEETDTKEEKKFSLDAYVDESFSLAMLEKETEDNKAFVEKVLRQMSAEEIFTKIVELSKENNELKSFKAEKIAIEKETKLNAIMSNVKDDLDEKTFADLKTEGETLEFSELGAFENKVKAFAYEASKNKAKEQEDNEIMKFSLPETQSTIVEQDVFDKYL